MKDGDSSRKGLLENQPQRSALLFETFRDSWVKVQSIDGA